MFRCKFHKLFANLCIIPQEIHRIRIITNKPSRNKVAHSSFYAMSGYFGKIFLHWIPKRTCNKRKQDNFRGMKIYNFPLNGNLTTNAIIDCYGIVNCCPCSCYIVHLNKEFRKEWYWQPSTSTLNFKINVYPILFVAFDTSLYFSTRRSRSWFLNASWSRHPKEAILMLMTLDAVNVWWCKKSASQNNKRVTRKGSRIIISRNRKIRRRSWLTDEPSTRNIAPQPHITVRICIRPTEDINKTILKSTRIPIFFKSISQSVMKISECHQQHPLQVQSQLPSKVSTLRYNFINAAPIIFPSLWDMPQARQRQSILKIYK